MPELTKDGATAVVLCALMLVVFGVPAILWVSWKVAAVGCLLCAAVLLVGAVVGRLR